MKLLEKNSVKEKLASAQLYCITTSPQKGQSYEEMVEQACQGGADILQLREKNLSAKELFLLAKKVREICRRHDTLFIVNDRVDIALAAGADGVHLGQDDLPLQEAKKIVNFYLASLPRRQAGGIPASPSGGRHPCLTVRRVASDFIIGVSTHSLQQALAAEREDADYVGCGPIFATPTKPETKPVGLNLIREYRRHLKIPFVAIGGIEGTNLPEVLAAGAKCVAVVRAVCGQEFVEEAARTMKKQICRLSQTDK